jgi:outer membrane receptor protein involved in Fe transport
MSGHRKKLSVAVLLATAAGTATAQTGADTGRDGSAESLDQVIIYAPYGTPIDRDRVSANTQSASAGQIQRAQALDLTDFLNRNFASVSINHAQNNPLQPDFNFRGFTASPLLGLPQGLAVYQNGVRVNEPFGDTVNWDLVPLSAVDSVQLLAGANPVFGLNSLGGALSVQMKNGFNYEGTAAEVYGGSFARRAGSVQSGGNNGRWGYYANVDYFEEDGWRDFSKSDALRFFGALSMRGDRSALDLSVAHTDSELRGNGASPVELLEIDRSQVFTHPDLTENSMTQLILEGSFKLSDSLRFAGNTYFRDIDTDTFNGDGTIFEECELGDDEFLVEEDFDDLNGDDECSADDDDEIELVRDPQGNPIEAEIDGEELDAINNIGRRKQKAHGASFQMALGSDLGTGRRNDFTLGTAYNDGETAFNSVVEVARLLENRATSRTGIFADEFRTNVDSDIRTWSLYFIDTLDVTERLTFTLAGRYDNTRIQLADRSGQSPELDGDHEFDRFNPAAGVTFRMSPAVVMFASVSQSARAPTPVELACASEDAPCNLPNAFLADPPLDEVVASSAELGARGSLAGGLSWHAGVFQTTNKDDILFQTTGGAQANVGFFDNVGDTRRAGVEVGLRQRIERVQWSVEYSLVEATFEDAFNINSPNHPVFEDEPDAPEIVGDGKLLVTKGSAVPGIPRHQINAGIDIALTDRLTFGTDVSFRSGVYLRGDETNLMSKTSSYTLVNLRGEYRFTDNVRVFARVENLFDEEYQTFGLLGEPDEVFPEFEDPRFFGAGPPLGAWAGVRVNF